MKTLRLGFAMACLFFLCSAAVAEPPLPGMSIYNLDTPWTTQDGKETHLSSLRGQPVIISMIYTSCPDICPLIAESMGQIERDLPKHSRVPVNFALFSFDPVRDKPATLKEFAKVHRLNLERWTLFHGEDRAVRELAAALDISYQRNAEGGFDHSVEIVLLDAEGVVVYRQSGFRPDTKEFISHVEALNDRQAK